MSKEIPKSIPYIVFVLPVAAIAGIISIGLFLPLNFVMTSAAFFALKSVINDHIGNKPMNIKRIVKAYDTINNIVRSEEHTSELQSRFDLVCRLLLEK